MGSEVAELAVAVRNLPNEDQHQLIAAMDPDVVLSFVKKQNGLVTDRGMDAHEVIEVLKAAGYSRDEIVVEPNHPLWNAHLVLCKRPCGRTGHQVIPSGAARKQNAERK